MFKNLFKQVGVKDVVTLFHNPSSPASIRVNTLLKQIQANSHANATIDQASEHSTQKKLDVSGFTIDVEEDVPTRDQLVNILEYLGPSQASNAVENATGATDALKKFNKNENVFKRPILIDWSGGRAVAGDNESEILKLLGEVGKEPTQD